MPKFKTLFFMFRKYIHVASEKPFSHYSFSDILSYQHGYLAKFTG